HAARGPGPASARRRPGARARYAASAGVRGSYGAAASADGQRLRGGADRASAVADHAAGLAQPRRTEGHLRVEADPAGFGHTGEVDGEVNVREERRLRVRAHGQTVGGVDEFDEGRGRRIGLPVDERI